MYQNPLILQKEIQIVRHVLRGKSTRKQTQTLLTLNKKSVLPPGNFMGNLTKSCSPKSHHSLSFMHTTHLPVDTLQLAKTVNKKKNHRRQKAKLVCLGASLGSGSMGWIFEGLAPCPPFLTSVVAYMLCFKIRMVPPTGYQLY